MSTAVFDIVFDRIASGGKNGRRELEGSGGRKYRIEVLENEGDERKKVQEGCKLRKQERR